MARPGGGQPGRNTVLWQVAQAAAAAAPAAVAAEAARLAVAEAEADLEKLSRLAARAAYAASSVGQDALKAQAALRKKLAEAQAQARGPAPAEASKPPVAAPGELEKSAKRQQSLQSQIAFAGSAQGKAALAEEAKLRLELNKAQKAATGATKEEEAARKTEARLLASVGIAASLGAGPLAQAGGAAASAYLGNYAQATVQATGALAGLARAASPTVMNTVEDSFTLLAATIGQDLTPSFLTLARTIQQVQKDYEGSLVQKVVRGATGEGEGALEKAGKYLYYSTLMFNPVGLYREGRKLVSGEEEKKPEATTLSFRDLPVRGGLGTTESYTNSLLTAGLQGNDLQTQTLQKQYETLQQILGRFDQVLGDANQRRGLDLRYRG